MKKKLCISIVSIIVILSIVFIVVKILNSKRDRSSFNNEDTFFDVLDSKEYLKNMTTYKNKSKEYENYIITLENSLFEKEMENGYFVFSIAKKNGMISKKEADEISKKFNFGNTCLMWKYDDWEYSAGAVYYYLYTGSIEPSKGELRKIYFYDSSSDKYYTDSEEYGFDIIPSDKAVKSQAGGTSIILSPIGLMIDGQKRPPEVCINYKDGSKLNLVKNGELNDFLLDGVGSNNYSSEYRFKKCISIEGVESITVVNYDYEISEELSEEKVSDAKEDLILINTIDELWNCCDTVVNVSVDNKVKSDDKIEYELKVNKWIKGEKEDDLIKLTVCNNEEGNFRDVYYYDFSVGDKYLFFLNYNNNTGNYNIACETAGLIKIEKGKKITVKEYDPIFGKCETYKDVENILKTVQ